MAKVLLMSEASLTANTTGASQLELTMVRHAHHSTESRRSKRSRGSCNV